MGGSPAARLALLVAPDAACSAVDGREYSEGAMAEFEASAVGRALRAQARLDDAVPIGESLIPATHNSYNSAAYHPTVSGLDHNQVASMTDQLRMGMRSLELDIHWFPSPHGDPDDGGFAPSHDSPWCGLVHERFGRPYAWHESKSAVGTALATTKDAAGVDEVWLDYRKAGGNWVPNP